jgi:glutamate racemase
VKFTGMKNGMDWRQPASAIGVEDGMSPTAPIAVLDSGLGGLTVVAALRKEMPREDIIYFGDTARVPYGSKSRDTVTEFTRQIVRYLRRYDPKHVVVACNTATALALKALRDEFRDLSISGVIEPGARAAAQAAGTKQFPTFGVIATEATVRSRAYEHALARRRHHARLYMKAAPLLVPIIEEGRGADDPLVVMAVEQYLEPLKKTGMDVLVLGCTHYPMLKGLIAKVVGPKVAVIDSAERCAEDVCRRLMSGGLLRGDAAREGRLHCFVTDESPRFATLARRFLGFDIPAPTWVPAEELYGAEEAEMTLSGD